MPHRTLVMGVLNVTPDSFYAPSRVLDPETARERARTMIEDGADILDVGAESSRPGSSPVSLEEELDRLLPILEVLVAETLRVPATISVDTYRAETARRAVALGAGMINDITALRGDAEMAGVIAGAKVECVLMHMLGEPRTMQAHPRYNDVVDDICRFFEERLSYAVKQGIAEDRIWLDPGFGFGKTQGHNLTILRRLGEFKRFGRPVLIGTSNKSTIGKVLGLPEDERAEGTAATVAIAVANGADAVRVHDVRAMTRVVRMADAITGKVVYD